MGARATNNGISVQFCFADGSPNGVPLYGRFAELFGKRQEQVIASGPAQTPDEAQVRGSDDWLTLIVVADTQDKLDQILRVTPAAVLASTPQTSHSSRRVAVELDIGSQRQSLTDCITIASGPIVSIATPIIDVVHVKILPHGIAMADLAADHPLKAEFVGGSFFIRDQ